MSKFEFTYEDEDGVETTVKFPAKWEVCGCCNGNGTTYLGWASRDQPAFTSEDFAEEGPDFAEEYFGGHYDKPCPECNGRTTVKVIDEDACTTPELKEALDAYHERQEDDAAYDRECRAERDFGC